MVLQLLSEIKDNTKRQNHVEDAFNLIQATSLEEIEAIEARLSKDLPKQATLVWD